jgi:predicted transposase YdaD
MKTDAHCKLLARLCPDDMLVLIGDPGAQVLSADIVELSDIQRTVDFAYQLQRGDQVYYHHVEFQGESDPMLIPRCFIYNTQMTVQYNVPVLTTIVYLFPEAEQDEPVFRVRLGDREINRWVFQCVRLWELDANAALAQGLPGLAALVPLMKGVQWEHIPQAVHQIETTAPAEHQSDLLAILHAFGQYQYTIEQLNRIIGRERIMESWIYQEGRAEGLLEGHTKGLLEGQLAAARELCREAVRHWHPRAGKRVWKAISDCTDLAALKEVTVNASEWSTRDILHRLTGR